VAELSEPHLNLDLTAAMKARDMPRVYVLRGLLTAAKNLKVEKRGEAPTAAELVQIVRREIRKREEAIEFAEKAGRVEIVEQNRAEIALLEVYMPASVDTTELERVVRELAASPDTRNMGAIMGTLRERYAGRLDGRQASELVRRVLAEANPS